MFGYSLNYLIDMEGSVILDVEATPTRISKEVDATETMIERTEERKKIETLFGEAKNILSMVRLRLRGLTGARDEFLLTATVQKLKRLAAHTTRPPPQPMMA